MSSPTAFPLGTYVGNPNGNDASAEASFEQQFNSFVATMGAKPQFMDGFVDPSLDPSQWASNAGWTAWSWASSPVVGTSITPVIGVPMADNNSWNNQDQFFQGIISGKYDADYKGIVDAWAQNGYKTAYFRLGYEMDGSFMPWFMGNDAQTQTDWVNAFRHLSTLMKQAGQADGINVKIVWNPNVTNWAPGNVANLYPGDQYVDVIAADAYSPQYPIDLTDWASGGTTQDATFAQWAANPINREHYWTDPTGNQWNPNGQAGVGWSVQDTINLALAHHKPIGIAETGAGGNGTTNGPVDDLAFPAWLAGELSQPGAPQVAFVNIWDAAMSDGNWDFTSPGANKPNEATAWAKFFGAGSSGGSGGGSGGGGGSVSNGGTVGTGTDRLVLSISEDRYANGDGSSDANGDATFVVLVDGKRIGGTLTAAAMHAQGQTEQFTVLGNFGPGTHSVELQLTNDAWSGVSSATTDRNIYVNGVTYNGAKIAYTGKDVNGGGAWFSVNGGSGGGGSGGSGGGSGGGGGSVSNGGTVGTGTDRLVLSISGDRYANGDGSSDANGDATFVVLVDGKRIGGTLTATAMHAQGQTEQFTVLGNFGPGTHSVEVQLTNDAWSGVSSATTDRNIYVNGVTYNGAKIAYTGKDVNGGGAWFSVNGGSGGGGSGGSGGGSGGGGRSVSNGGTVGTGTDRLVLSISEDRYANSDGSSDANGDATFVVLVDGKRIGGTLTATAMHAQGQTEQFTVLGNFGPGTHSVEVQLTNDAWSGVSTPTTDRNIYVNGVTYNGAKIAYTGNDVNGGGAWFSVNGGSGSPGPPDPPPLLHAAGSYFATPDGTSVYLAGSHTWNQAQQIGPQAFTFAQFVNFEQSIGGNFIRYWVWDQSNEGDGTIPDSQLPFLRSSTPGANDGGAKWDLTRFNQTFFDNMRANVIAAGQKGMYVSIMLFTGEAGWDSYSKASWNNDPFNSANNVIGVNPGSPEALQNLGNTAFLAAQEAYVAKVIDTVGNLSNVLFEVSNESANDTATFAWQNAIADFVKSYEAQKGYAQHPVGITAPFPGGDPNVNNSTLFTDPHSDWTAPYGWYDYQNNPPDAPGNKPVIVDTDHVGGGKDGGWIWEMFTRGYNVALMDNMGGSGLNDPLWGNQNTNPASLANARLAIKDTTQVARLFDLAKMAPRDGLSSTGYALANPSGGQYAVYAPNGGQFSVDLSGSSGTLNVQWVNVDTGSMTADGTTQAGVSRNFSSLNMRDALILTPSAAANGLISSPSTTAVDASGSSSPTDDTLVLNLSADLWQGSPRFIVSIDGKQLGGPQSVTAVHSAGQTQAFDFTGMFGSGQHDVAVSFINDAWGGTPETDRNLYVNSIAYDGQHSGSETASLLSNGTVHFTVGTPVSN